MDHGKAQIYGALIVAVMSVVIAIGGFLHSGGKIEAHLTELQRRETRMETKVDDIQEHVHRMDIRLARIEAGSHPGPVLTGSGHMTEGDGDG